MTGLIGCCWIALWPMLVSLFCFFTRTNCLSIQHLANIHSVHCFYTSVFLFSLLSHFFLVVTPRLYSFLHAHVWKQWQLFLTTPSYYRINSTVLIFPSNFHHASRCKLTKLKSITDSITNPDRRSHQIKLKVRQCFELGGHVLSTQS